MYKHIIPLADFALTNIIGTLKKILLVIIINPSENQSGVTRVSKKSRTKARGTLLRVASGQLFDEIQRCADRRTESDVD